MKSTIAVTSLAAMLIVSTSAFGGGDKEKYYHEKAHKHHKRQSVQLGPRPYYLVEDMDDSELKDKLMSCTNKCRFRKTDFSIGHRGAPMQFPEHTRESYVAAARMGAGIIECDVTFTKDRELVCRHSQCDLHTTTNILKTDLAAKCSVPPVIEVDENGNEVLTNASAIKCCTSDITVTEFKTLSGKMDAANRNATSIDEYMDATADWRTDLYTGSGTLLTHKESIALFKQLGVKMTPELKSPSVEMPFEGDYTQEDYAQQMVDEYKEMGVHAKKVFAQSFNIDDVRYWIENEPRFGMQAVYLDGRYSDSSFDYSDPLTWSPSMEDLVADGVKIIAPPMWMLLDVDAHGKVIPSTYAKYARQVGLDIITWTFERSDLREGATSRTWYHRTTHEAVDNAGDRYVSLDVLAKEVGIIGIFSDWPATVSYYANCMGMK